MSFQHKKYPLAKQLTLYFQRLVDGKPDGASLPIAVTDYYEVANDVNGDYILYTW